MLHNVHRNASVGGVVHQLHDHDRLDDPRGGRHPLAPGRGDHGCPGHPAQALAARVRRISRTRSSRCSRPGPGSCPRSSSSPTASTAMTSAASWSGSHGIATMTNPIVASTIVAGRARGAGRRRLAGAVRRGLHGRAPGVDQRARSGARSWAPRPGRDMRRPRSWRSAWRRSGPASAWPSTTSSSPRCIADRVAAAERPASPRRSAVRIALDPYMFRSTPLTELPGLVADLGLPVHRAVASRGLHPLLPPSTGGPGDRARVQAGARRSGRARCRRCCRCSAGRVRTRTSGRRPCATGGAPSRSPWSWASRS